jgi:antitoxin ParD1/3/4
MRFYFLEHKPMTTVTISMPDSLKKFVTTQIKKKGFGNVSEYFRALVREEQAKEAGIQLEALLLEGLESGEDIKVTREFWQELKAEAATLLKKQMQKKGQRRKRG